MAGSLGALRGPVKALGGPRGRPVREVGHRQTRISEGEVATRDASLDGRRFGAEGLCTIAQGARPEPLSHPKSP